MKRSAFTLVEMLVVIAIAAILMTMIIGSFSQARYLAKRTKADAQLRELITAWHEYFILYGEWPVFTGVTTNGYAPMTYANLKYLIKPEENPRKLVLLNVTLPGSDATSSYKDPWGNTYELSFKSPDMAITDETALRLSVQFPNRKRRMNY